MEHVPTCRPKQQRGTLRTDQHVAFWCPGCQIPGSNGHDCCGDAGIGHQETRSYRCQQQACQINGSHACTVKDAAGRQLCPCWQGSTQCSPIAGGTKPATSCSELDAIWQLFQFAMKCTSRLIIELGYVWHDVKLAGIGIL